jgi:hypothetical protein
MRRRRSGALALAVVAALSCTGCVQGGGDPGTAGYRQRWVGFLGAVEVAITRGAETGGGLFYATGSATVCVRFEIHGDNGPRRVTTREIDCPP